MFCFATLKIKRYGGYSMRAEPTNIELSLKYVKAINQPKTADELMVALNDPRSPIYQEMMDMLIEEIVTEEIVERLMQQYIQERKKEDEMSEEIAKEKLDKYLRAQEKQIQQHIIHLPLIASYQLEKESIVNLQSQIQKCDDEIKKLENTAEKLKSELTVINQNQATVNQQMVDIQNTHITHVIMALKDGKIERIGSDGKIIPIDAAAEQRIKHILAPRPAVTNKILEMVNASHQTYYSKKKLEAKRLEGGVAVAKTRLDAERLEGGEAVAKTLELLMDLVANDPGNENVLKGGKERVHDGRGIETTSVSALLLQALREKRNSKYTEMAKNPALTPLYQDTVSNFDKKTGVEKKLTKNQVLQGYQYKLKNRAEHVLAEKLQAEVHAKQNKPKPE